MPCRLQVISCRLEVDTRRLEVHGCFETPTACTLEVKAIPATVGPCGERPHAIAVSPHASRFSPHGETSPAYAWRLEVEDGRLEPTPIPSSRHAVGLEPHAFPSSRHACRSSLHACASSLHALTSSPHAIEVSALESPETPSAGRLEGLACGCSLHAIGDTPPAVRIEANQPRVSLHASPSSLARCTSSRLGATIDGHAPTESELGRRRERLAIPSRRLACGLHRPPWRIASRVERRGRLEATCQLHRHDSPH